MERFQECLQFILRPDIEGGFVDDPLDHGGRTNKGITQRTYTSWLRGRKEPDHDVKLIRDDEVAAIYHEQYWVPVQGDRMNQPVDLILFDAAVQHGVSRAVRLLQEALQLPVDGAMNQATFNGALLDPPSALALDLLSARANFYGRICENNPSQKRFAAGWANRLDKARVAAGL